MRRDRQGLPGTIGFDATITRSVDTADFLGKPVDFLRFGVRNGERLAGPLREIEGQPVVRPRITVDSIGIHVGAQFHLLVLLKDGDAGQRQRLFGPHPIQRCPRIFRITRISHPAHVNAIIKDTHRKDVRSQGIGAHLPVEPDQHLLVVPGQPYADVFYRRQAVFRGFFGERACIDGLEAVQDLRKPVVIIRGFALLIVVNPSQGHAIRNREKDRRKERTGRAGRHRGNARGKPFDKILVPLHFRCKVTTGVKISVDPSAVFKDAGRQPFGQAVVDKTRPFCQLRVAEAICVDLAPGYLIR